jgi:hypothetical protein
MVARTEGMRCTMSPGSGDFPVGQFDAQNLLPKGSGTPSFASSAYKKIENLSHKQINKGREMHDQPTLINSRSCICHRDNIAQRTVSSNKSATAHTHHCTPTTRKKKTHLSATITDSARSALFPNTFPKNSAATVTPDARISCFVAALMHTNPPTRSTTSK